MKRRSHILLLAAAMALFLTVSDTAAGENRFMPLVESYAGGWIDWAEGAIYGIGRGAVDLHNGSRPMASRAAKVTALQSILKIAAGIQDDEAKTLRDLSARSGAIELEALIRFTVWREGWVTNVARPYYETVLRAPMTGIEGLTARIVQALRDRPRQWDRTPGALPDENAPWLVLDARRAGRALSISPALFPRIVSERGKTLYDLARADEKALVHRGMARYITAAEDTDARRFGRVLPDRAVVRPATASAGGGEPVGSWKMPGRYVVAEVVAVRGAANTILVVGERDAASLLSEDAVSGILKRCRVIIVVARPQAAFQNRSNGPAPVLRPPFAESQVPIPAFALAAVEHRGASPSNGQRRTIAFRYRTGLPVSYSAQPLSGIGR